MDNPKFHPFHVKDTNVVIHDNSIDSRIAIWILKKLNNISPKVYKISDTPPECRGKNILFIGFPYYNPTTLECKNYLILEKKPFPELNSHVSNTKIDAMGYASNIYALSRDDPAPEYIEILISMLFGGKQQDINSLVSGAETLEDILDDLKNDCSHIKKFKITNAINANKFIFSIMGVKDFEIIEEFIIKKYSLSKEAVDMWKTCTLPEFYLGMYDGRPCGFAMLDASNKHLIFMGSLASDKINKMDAANLMKDFARRLGVKI